MIASIFKKSKPINLIILAIVLLSGYLISLFQLGISEITTSFLVRKTLGFLVLLYSMFIVDFIVKKNQLNEQNSYAVLTYTFLLLLFSNGFLNSEIVASNLFILLALRRCLSLKSQIEIKKKIFDATLWILVASIFNIWAIAFLLILLVSIILYCANDFKNWLVPLVSFLIVTLIFQTTHKLIYDGFYWPQLPEFSLFSILSGGNKHVILPMGLITLWALVVFFASLGQKKIVLKRSLILVFIIFLVAVLVNVIAKNQELFMLFPISVFIGILFQEIKKSIVSEIVTTILMLMVMVNYFI